jgi:membrane fusion protein (multidrug efflux system)
LHNIFEKSRIKEKRSDAQAWEGSMRLFLFATIVVGGVLAQAQAQEQQAVPVGTLTVEKHSISQSIDFVGRVDGIEKVEVRARVAGFLESVLFKEGDVVQAGAPLYRIEQSLFQASVERSQGALEVSKAADALADLQLTRATDLMNKQAGTVASRDQAAAQKEQTAGSVMISEADLATAKVNLSYTNITSPITGRIGRTNVTKGNVVGPDSGVMATIISQDPMYVSFPVSQRNFLKSDESGRPIDPKSIKVQIRFSDGTVYDQPGQIQFIDVTVARETDTVLVRATVPNPKGALTDGQLVRVNLEGGTPEEKVLVPQAALIADQQGAYVFVVEDGKAVVKRLKLSGESGVNSIVDSGLAGGEQVIVDGLQSVRPGAPVRAAPVPSPLKGS